MKVCKISNDYLGNLTIIVNDNGCWFLTKELLTNLKLKLSNKKIEEIISPKNLLKLDHKRNKNYECYKSLWEKKNDHSEKILINKFGVIQLLFNLNINNINEIIDNFICMTFKKSFLATLNIQQQCQSISEIERLRLKLFSDNKLEVIKAHKELLRLERENTQTKLKNDTQIQTKNESNTNLMIKINQEKMYEGIVNELTKAKDEIEYLKNQIGRGQNWSTVSFRKKEWKTKFGHFPDWKRLCKLSESMGIKPIKDCIEKDNKGIERKVNRYHNDVWDAYEKEEYTLKENMNKKTTNNELNQIKLPF